MRRPPQQRRFQKRHTAISGSGLYCGAEQGLFYCIKVLFLLSLNGGTLRGDSGLQRVIGSGRELEFVHFLYMRKQGSGLQI